MGYGENASLQETAHDEYKKKCPIQDGKRLTSWKVMPCLVPSDFIRILAPLDASPEGMGTDCDHKATKQKSQTTTKTVAAVGGVIFRANRA